MMFCSCPARLSFSGCDFLLFFFDDDSFRRVLLIYCRVSPFPVWLSFPKAFARPIELETASLPPQAPRVMFPFPPVRLPTITYPKVRTFVFGNKKLFRKVGRTQDRSHLLLKPVLIPPGCGRRRHRFAAAALRRAHRERTFPPPLQEMEKILELLRILHGAKTIFINFPPDVIRQ